MSVTRTDTCPMRITATVAPSTSRDGTILTLATPLCHPSRNARGRIKAAAFSPRRRIRYMVVQTVSMIVAADCGRDCREEVPKAMPNVPALAGITIIDLTRYLAGPFCTQILGDYGAEVIKLEPVKGARSEMGGYTGKDSYFFMSTNRSKKSVQIDLRQAAGRDVMLRLTDSADA